jgi:hypothetical protein
MHMWIYTLGVAIYSTPNLITEVKFISEGEDWITTTDII